MTMQEGEAEPPEELSIGTIYRLLDNPHHRIVLELLSSADRKATVNDLAVEICVRKNDTEIPSGEQLTNAAMTLHHLHLPKLADHGVVSYDPDRRIAKATDGIAQIEPHLSLSGPKSTPPGSASECEG